MTFTPTATRKTIVLGSLVLGGLAVFCAWSVYSLVESVNRLLPIEAANQMPHFDREQRQRAIQALHDQAWWIVAVFLASASAIVGFLLAANWLVHREFAQRQLTDKRLREREARLKTILDSEPECVKLVAEDGRILEMNAAGLQMIEAGSVSQVIGHQVEELLAPEYRREFQLLNERVFRGESTTLEYELIGLKGGRRWMETHAAPLRDEKGQVIAQLGITRDITARKLAVEAMCQANAQLLATLDAIPDLLFVVDVTGRIYDFRAPQPELLYVPPQQFLGKCMRDVLPAEAAQVINNAIQDADAKGLHRGTTYSLDLPQGKSWFELSIARKKSVSGTDSRFVLLARDITERKLAETALQESEARYRLLADNTEDFVMLGDTQGNRLYVSPSYFRVTGWTLEDLQLTDWRTRLHPNDLPMIEQTRAANLAGETTLIEHRIHLKNGAWIWVELLCKPVLGPEGEVLQLLQWSRDITDRKQVEQDLRASQASLEMAQAITRIGSWEFDPVYCTGRWSKEMFRLFDRDPKLGTPSFEEFLESVHPDDRHILLDANSQVAQSDRTLEVSYRVAPAFGGLRYFSGKIHATLDEFGRVLQLNGTLWDVTERKQAEEALRDSQQRLAVLSRQLLVAQESERRQVARELHDEIGQMLAAVNWKLRHLKSVCGPEAHSELDAGLGLVGQAMSQVRDLSFNLRPPTLDILGLDAAVRSCVEQHRQQTGCDVQLEIELESRLSPELEITCYRVIQSALTNIARHAQASHVSVEIRENDLGLEVVVSDNGVGLDLDDVRQRSGQGECFGILAMQERVQLWGGSFRIDSAATPGTGTSIHAHLPLATTVAGRSDPS